MCQKERWLKVILKNNYIKMFLGTIKRLPLFISTIIPKKNNLYVFGAWFGQKYSDNSRALFELALKNNQLQCVWITRNIEVYNFLKSQGLPVQMENSIRGIWTQLRAKVAISCTGKDDFNSKLLGSSYHIELWHGVGGGKTIGFDDEQYCSQMDTIRGRYYQKLEKYPYRNSYFICTSNVMKKVFMRAFRLPESHYIMAGQPRNDMFYDEEYKISTIDISQFKGRKVISYLPTHRKTGTKPIECDKLFDLKKLNDFCKDNGCIFVIKKHFYHKNEVENVGDYEYILDWSNCTDIDTNEFLMVTDYLISDYSSVATDYLLMERPVMYYCYDYKEYIENDRDMYWNYEDITPGPKVENFDQLMNSLNLIIRDNKDEYAEDRQRVLNMFYGKQARKEVGEDILNYIGKLINKI